MKYIKKLICFLEGHDFVEPPKGLAAIVLHKCCKRCDAVVFKDIKGSEEFMRTNHVDWWKHESNN